MGKITHFPCKNMNGDESHKLQRQFNHWRDCCDEINKILLKLAVSYRAHKTSFPTARYAALKSMINTALEEYHSLLDRQTAFFNEEYLHMMSKRKHDNCKQETADGSIQASPDSKRFPFKKPINSLTADLKAFATKTTTKTVTCDKNGVYTHIGLHDIRRMTVFIYVLLLIKI